MGWLRVLDIPFDILASLMYRSTPHSRPGCTNMAPQAPQVATMAETRGTTARHNALSTDVATQVADPTDPYGGPGSPGAVAAALGSSGNAAQELLRHAAMHRVEDECCLAMWDFSATQSASAPDSRS